MIYPFADKLDNLGSKYALVIVTAKRAKQLKSGVQPVINTDSRNPLTVALEEIAMGKIGYAVPDNDLIEVATEEPEVAQLLAIPTRGDEDTEAEAAPVLDNETPLSIEKSSADLDEEGLEEWEDNDEEEVVPLDAHLESGIILDPDADDNEEEAVEPLIEEEPKPKARRGRKPAQPEPEIDVDLGIELDPDIDLAEDDIEIEEE